MVTGKKIIRPLIFIACAVFLLSSKGSAETTFFDDFNRTSIGSNWTVARGTWSINSSKLYHSATAGGVMVLNVPLGTNNYNAEAGFEFTDLVSGNFRGIILRYQNVSNFYSGQYHRYDRKFRIVKVLNGVSVTLAEAAAPSVANYSFHPIRFSAEGTNLKLYFDGALVLQASDATYTGGKVGIYSKSYYHRFDDFRATTISSTPPTVSVNPVTSPTNQSSCALTGTKSSGSSVYANGNQIVALSAETVWLATVSLNVEGQNNFVIKAKNDAGVESNPVNATVIRDTMPPQIQFSSPAANAYVNQIQTLVRGAVDGIPFSMIAELTEGANVVQKTAVDDAGNQGTAALHLILDTVAPTIEVISPSYNSWVNDPEVTVHYHCEDEASVCSDHDIDLELEHEGTNQIPVVHTDLAGNVGIAWHVVRLDTTPPEIIFTSHGDGETVKSNQETITYTIDGEPGSIPFPLTHEGPNVCQIVAEDPAGNFTIASLTLIRDTTPPNFTVVFPEQGGYINQSEVIAS